VASGKVSSGFHIARAVALGADMCNCARAMMLAVGCIQALQCNTNKCPVGVATQDPKFTVGLDVNDKKHRVASYHRHTIKTFVELLGASGLNNMYELTRSHIYRRISLNSMLTYEEIFPSSQEILMAEGIIPEKYQSDFARSEEHTSELQS